MRLHWSARYQQKSIHDDSTSYDSPTTSEFVRNDGEYGHGNDGSDGVDSVEKTEGGAFGVSKVGIPLGGRLKGIHERAIEAGSGGRGKDDEEQKIELDQTRVLVPGDSRKVRGIFDSAALVVESSADGHCSVRERVNVCRLWGISRVSRKGRIARWQLKGDSCAFIHLPCLCVLSVGRT